MDIWGIWGSTEGKGSRVAPLTQPAKLAGSPIGRDETAAKMGTPASWDEKGFGGMGDVCGVGILRCAQDDGKDG